MPVIDDLNVVSDSQDLGSTSASAQVQSTDVLDLSGGLAKDHRGNTIHPDIRGGLNVVVEDEELSASGGGGSLNIDVMNHTASTSIKSGNLIARYTVEAIGAASSGKPDGTYLVRDLSVPVGKINERYLGIVYQAITKQITAGKVTAWFGDHATEVNEGKPVAS